MKIKKMILRMLFATFIFGFPQMSHARSAVVTDIVDGDTIIVDTDTRVQLLGVDALGSSKGDYRAKEMNWLASEFTSDILKGKKVRLEFDPVNKLKNHQDRWKRLLAYVYLEDGTFFNHDMIEQGYASAYLKYPFEMKEKFVQTEKNAQEEHRGLWKLHENAGKKKDSPRKIYVASKRKKVYHEGSCHLARNIPVDERITFKEESEANKLGYKKGRWCIPVLMKRFWGE